MAPYNFCKVAPYNFCKVAPYNLCKVSPYNLCKVSPYNFGTSVNQGPFTLFFFRLSVHLDFHFLVWILSLDWMMWGWSCLSHLCIILMGHSDIVEVIVYFKPSQCSYHIRHWTGTVIVQKLLNSRDSGNLVNLMNLEILVTLVNLVGLVDLIDLAYGAE